MAKIINRGKETLMVGDLVLGHGEHDVADYDKLVKQYPRLSSLVELVEPESPSPLPSHRLRVRHLGNVRAAATGREPVQAPGDQTPASVSTACVDDGKQATTEGAGRAAEAGVQKDGEE